VNRIKILVCRLGLHLWCTPPGPFWIRAYQQHVYGEEPAMRTVSKSALSTGPRRSGDAER
jgi:hypothetical protein